MKRILILIALLAMASTAFGFGSYGTNVNNNCPSQPYNGDCNYCHVSDRGAPTAEKDAYLTGDWCFFCPNDSVCLPPCTDNDGDGFAQEGGSCGTVDCNDNSAEVYPGAPEVCGDNIDQSCSGSDEACPVVCTDSDRDGFSVEGGECGAVDCNDNDATVNPGATETCGDNIDQDCSGSDEVCPVVCTDNDGDNFAVEGGECGLMDCDDSNAAVFPGAIEICGDGIDQSCTGSDEACPTPECTDLDNDGFAVEGGSCGVIDCDDSDNTVYPGATDICGDGIDQDCKGGDLVCSGPSCTDLDGDTYAIEGGDCGPVDCDDDNAAVNPGAAERCSDGLDNNCDNLIDTADMESCPAQATCTDVDQDGYNVEGGECGIVDCNDTNGSVYPGATEVCGDGLDNDCDEQVDENCDVPAGDGYSLYDNYCASCHDMLYASDVCGDDAEDILDAIAENEGGMGALSSLTDAQIAQIAEALATCAPIDSGSSVEEEEEEEEEEENSLNAGNERGQGVWCEIHNRYHPKAHTKGKN